MDDISIVVIGFIGIDGTKILLEKKKENLLSRFSLNFLQEKIYNLDKIEKVTKNFDFINFKKNKFLFKDVNDERTIYEIKKGGFLSSLWMAAESVKSGLEYELFKVPILQITIEVAEFFNINPYRLYSNNAYIVFTNDKKELFEKFYNEYGEYLDLFPIMEIGKLKKIKSRRRIDSDAMAFLTKDYKDEIDKVIEKYTKVK